MAKRWRVRSLFCGLVLVLMSGCASQTLFESQPAGATVIMEGDRYVGQTPVQVRDLPMLGAKREYQFMMEGYHPRIIQVGSRSENRHLCACVGSLGLLWPLLLFRSYPSDVLVELQRVEPAPRAEFRADPQVNFGPR